MRYIMTIVSLFAADGVIKYLVEKSGNIGCKELKPNGAIIIKKYHNKGAMMNMGDKNQYLIALLSLIFSAFVTGMFVVTFGMKGKGLLNTGLAMILGGAYSNTYDRLKRKYVVDYISFRITTKKYSCKFLNKLADKFSAIVFNISDFGIIIGAMLLIISELMTKRNRPVG